MEAAKEGEEILQTMIRSTSSEKEESERKMG